MRVIVYVEGPSDRYAMETLLKPLIERKEQCGVRIDFRQAPPGDKKVSLLTKVPVRSVTILRNDPSACVVVLPDLYPKGKGFPHKNETDLAQGVRDAFGRAMHAKGVGDDERIMKRFTVHCFKHDLEALVLAAVDELRRHLEMDDLQVTWRTPVEEQDDDYPPKRVVEELFRKCGRVYAATFDVPAILSGADYHDIADKCPQCFKPFVDFLEGLTPPPANER